MTKNSSHSLCRIALAMAMVSALEMGARRVADLHRQLRRHRPCVGAPAYAVGAEISSGHAFLMHRRDARYQPQNRSA